MYLPKIKKKGGHARLKTLPEMEARMVAFKRAKSFANAIDPDPIKRVVIRRVFLRNAIAK